MGKTYGGVACRWGWWHDFTIVPTSRTKFETLKDPKSHTVSTVAYGLPTNLSHVRKLHSYDMVKKHNWAFER